MNARQVTDSTLRHIAPAVMFTIVTVILFGLIYPFVMTPLSEALFPSQASGSIIYKDGKPVASDIIGQLWKSPRYFHGRPSAAGNGYDPTSTGATNLGPTSKKLIDATKAAITALRKENPDATGPIPTDLVTSSASGIDPDISPEAAYYQAPRIAKARHITVASVDAIIDRHEQPRTWGILGDPRVDVVQLNLALDGAQ